jgi:CBS domain-containing protein
MNIAALMTRDPIHVDVDADLDMALRLMDLSDVRHLPVVERGRFVGVVTDRDLLQATGWLPRGAREPRTGALATCERQCVREIMHAPAMHAESSDDILSLSVEAVVQGFGCIPVVENERLVGIVTERDMLRAYLENRRETPSVGEEPFVEQVMSRPARSIPRTATLREARDLCRRWNVRHLPVLENARLVGILSDRDLRRAAGRGCREDLPVDELMAKRPFTIPPEAPLTRAASLFLAHHCSALPVIANGDLVGIVTVEDLFDPCMKALG